MAEGSSSSEETKLLQEKLGDLDVGTLQELLQAAIASKTKESNQNESQVQSHTTSNVVDQATGTTENGALNSKTAGDGDTEVNVEGDGSGQSEIIENGGSESTVLQSVVMSVEATNNEMIPSSDTLANNLQTSQGSKSEPSPNTPNYAASPDLTPQTHQDIPVVKPVGFNQIGNFGNQNSQTGQDLKPADEYNIEPDKTSPTDQLHVPSSQPSTNFNLQSHFDQEPFTVEAEQWTKLNDPVGLPTTSNPPSTSIDQQNEEQLTQHTLQFPVEKQTAQPGRNIVQNNPFSSPTVASPPTYSYQPSGSPGMDGPTKDQVNHPDKGSPFGQLHAPSNQPPTNFYQHGQSDQKPAGIIHSGVHQANEGLPGYQFNPPSQSPSACCDQSHQTHTIPVLPSSTNDTRDAHNFPSAVPPLSIPLSKVGQYLPQGVVMESSETWIPLALKPLIVIKDQVAVMVFEQDNGLCKGCAKKQQLPEEQETQAAAKLSIQKQHAKFLNETPHQGSCDESLLNGEQGAVTTGIQQHQPPEQAQDFQPQQIREQQTQQPQQQQQLQNDFIGTNFPPASNPFQYQDPQQQQQQQVLLSLPQSTHQDPSRSHRSSSLPHVPSGQQTSGQQDQQQSNFVPGLSPPVWMNDEDCKSCKNCGKSFSVTRRKHHCRGCGKIFCNECCDQLAQLPYLGRKVARICITCTRMIRKAHADRDKRKKEGKSRSQSQSVQAPKPHRPAVNRSLLFIPSEDMSSQAMSETPWNNFNVPQTTNDAYWTSTTPVGNFNPVREVTPAVPDVPVQPSPSQVGTSSYGDRMSVGERSDSSRGFSQDGCFVGNSWKIPPRPAGRTITWTDYDPNMTMDEQRKRFKNLNKVLKTPEGAVIQAATKLSVTAKRIQVVVRQELLEAWFLCSVGFANCGQQEVAFILEKRIAEDVFPYEMLKVYRTLYSLVLNQGERFIHGNYLAFNNALLGNKENAGFLFIALNKTPKLVHHHAPRKSLLVGILLKQAELPCMRYVPTRLLNALGAQQQCFPSPALSSRDRPSVCNIEPNELFYSTFFAFNQFLNHKISQAMIPDVHILKSGNKVVLELPFSYQTEVISILDSLLVDDSQAVTVPIAGDVVPEANGHFLYSSSSTSSTRRGFVVLQNSDERVESGNQYLAFSAILLVLTFGDACNSQTRFGIEVVEDGITVTFSDGQAKEIRQAIYQGTNCAVSVGTSADSKDQFTLRWTGDTCPSILDVPTPIRVVSGAKKPSKGYVPAVAASPPVPRAEVGQTNVIIDRVRTRDIEAAIQTKITSEHPQQSVNKLENDVRQACGGCLLTFANRLRSNAEKRLNLTLSLGPGNYKKWSLGPNNQPINLARSLQLALNEIDVPEVNDGIVFVFNVILQKRN